MGRERGVTDAFKDNVVNQMVGVPVLRSLLDRLSRHPALAPRATDSDDIWDDPFHPELPLRKWRRLLPILGGTAALQGRVVLEVGCGMSLGMGIVGLALGARRCILADADRYLAVDVRTADSHRRLLDLLPSWFPGADLSRLSGLRITTDEVIPDGDRLEYRIAPAERLGMPDGSVDISLSHSVLEHVREIEPAVAEIARVTAPGGLGLHQIDLSDHIHAGSPLRMLAVSGRTWEMMARHRRGWTNRLRLPAYLGVFERAGLAVEDVQVTRCLGPEEIARLRPRLHPDFRGLGEDALAPLTALCILRRR